MATVVDCRLNHRVNVDNLKPGDGFCYNGNFYMKCELMESEQGAYYNVVASNGIFTTFCNCDVEPVNLIWSIK